MQVKRLSKSIRLVAVLGLLLVALVPVQPLSAQTTPNDQDFPTRAEVGGAGAGATMYIECKWEVVDTTPLTAAFTYDGVPVTPTDDDTPSQDQTLSDGTTTAGAPCVPTTAANAVNFKRHSIGLLPNQDDDPIERQYEKWVAVESTAIDQIGDVFWKVWEPYVADPPNGPNCASPVSFASDPAGELATAKYCFKYQHHATANLLPPTGTNPLIKQTCADLAGAGLADMWIQARNEGQLTDAERDAIILRCTQNEKAVYKVRETISKEQSFGEYRIEVTVVNTSGTPFTLVNYFDVLPFVYMKTDFSAIDWGTIQNNSTSNKSGDEIFLVGDGKPTVRNTGNAPLYLEGHFGPLVLTTDPTKSIVRFDLKFRAVWRTDPLTLTVVDPLLASNWVCFGDQPVGSNQNGKLDLSVHPENAQAGIYTGNLDLIARQNCSPPHTPTTNANNPTGITHTAGH